MTPTSVPPAAASARFLGAKLTHALRTASLLFGASVAAVVLACRPVRRAPIYLVAPSGTSAPFSAAVRVHGLIFLAGQLGTDSSGRVVPGGVEAETRQAMANVRTVLARVGSSLDRVIKCTVYLADMRELAAMNDAYVTFFAPGRRPARTAAGAAGLALGGRVEIECVAAE